MAKRRPVRDYRKQKRRPAHVVSGQCLDETDPGTNVGRVVTACLRSNISIPGKQRVEQAQQKHFSVIQDVRSSSSTDLLPSLGDRFRALPAELRAHIFSLLIVRPVKWDVGHKGKPLECSYNAFSSCYDEEWHCQYGCASDRTVTDWRKMRLEDTNPLESQWRSEWAPPQLNSFVCTYCYDNRLRQEPFPKPVSLPCLCARRKNLQVLLVCKQWYEEAGLVFYTQNTFAFEELVTFVDFVKNLNPGWRKVISKVSIVTLSATLPTAGEPIAERTKSKQIISGTWAQLNNLHSLSYLELDSIFLTRPKAIRSLLRLKLSNLRRLCFVSHLPFEISATTEPPPNVWTALAERQLLRGGFAEIVARGVTGQTESTLRGQDGHKAIKDGVERATAYQTALASLTSQKRA